MPLNKRELRKYAVHRLSIDQGHGLLHAEQVEYIVRTVVKIIDHRRMIILYVYSREQLLGGIFTPVLSVFQTRDDFVTLEFCEDGKTRWRMADFDNLRDAYGYFAKYCAFATQEDEQRLKQFIKPVEVDEEVTAFSALDRQQRAIKYLRWRQKTLAKEKHINALMNSLPALPRDLKGWLRREIVPAYIIYQYHKGKKPMDAHCTACHKKVKVSGVRHNEKGQCPQCKRRVLYKASGRYGRIVDRATAQVFQRLGERKMVVRIIKVYSTHDREDGHDLFVYEPVRIFYDWSGDGKPECRHFYHCPGSYRTISTGWIKGIRPKFSYYQYSFDGDICGYLYLRNIDEVLAGTPWQYSQLKQYCQFIDEPLETIPYLNTYTACPALEYLVRLKLYQLANTMVYSGGERGAFNFSGKNLREVLGAYPEDIPMMQKYNIGTMELKFIRDLHELGLSCNEELLLWYVDNHTHSDRDILTALEFMSVEKYMRYIDRQFKLLKGVKGAYGGRRYEDKGRIISEYRDYLRTCKELDYDMHNTFVLFPRSLMKAHDQTTELYKQKKTEIHNQKIAAMYQDLCERYMFAADGLSIIPPKNADDLVHEGHTLRHCVGTYAKSVANGESVVLFVRKSNAPDKPYFTMEVDDGRVIQLRGKGNCEPTKKVVKLVDLWQARKLKRAKAKKSA